MRGVKLIEYIINDLLDHAKDSYPRECCGLVVVFKGRYKYVRCTNIASKLSEFEISAQDFKSASELGEVVAVCHSHPNSNSTPTMADRSSCEIHGIPWLIVGYPLCDHTYFEPSGYKAPLIGRKFVHGVHDCFSLLRDYFETICIKVPEFERPARWWDLGYDLLSVENFKLAGFVEIPMRDLTEHDVIISQNGSNVPNHCMIYLGDNMILHHTENRLSSRDVFGGYHLKNSRYFLRHSSLLDKQLPMC